MMHVSDDFVRTHQLDFEGWRAFLRTSCGNQPEVIDASTFAGWVRPLSICGLAAAALKIECGFAASELGRSAYRSERTHRDVRFAGADYYYAVFQVAGRSVFTQNDEFAQLAVGDVALLDAARPAACSAGDVQWLRLQLPRQTLISHLGFEPQGGLHARAATSAARLLFDLVRDADKADGLAASAADSYPIRHPFRVMRTSCLRVSAAWSRTVLPIRISARARSQSKRGSRCVTFKSSLPRAARPAANSSIRFVWTMPRVFCIGEHHWVETSP